MAYSGIGNNNDILTNNGVKPLFDKNCPTVTTNSSTGTYSISATDNEVVYIHTAAGTATYNLPSAITGKVLYFFHKGDAPSSTAINQMKITPASGDEIVFKTLRVVAAGSLNINLRGVYIKLSALDSTTWHATLVNNYQHRKNDNRLDSQIQITLTGRNSWTSKTGITSAKSYPAFFNQNGYGYILSGSTGAASNTNEQYNDISDSWSTKATAGTARQQGAGFSLNGFGYNAGGIAGAVTTEVNKYNDSANTWSTVGSLNTAKRRLGGLSINGYGYVTGGNTGSVTAVVEKYNDNLDSWAAVTSLPVVKEFMSTIVLNGYSYACNGADSSVVVNTNYQYNDSSNAWSTRAVAGTARDESLGFSINGYGYSYGGFIAASTSEINEYNDQLNTWTTKTAGVSRYGHGGFSLNGYAYGVAGFDSTDTRITTNEQYN